MKLLTTLSVLMLSSAAIASPLSDARTTIGSSKLPVLNLNLSAQEQQVVQKIPMRFFSSIEVKRRFYPAIAALSLDERLGAPLTLNPGESALQHRQRMYSYRQGFCEKSLGLLKSGNLQGDAAFLNEMQGLSPRVLKENDAISQLPAALKTKLLAAINAQFAASAAAVGAKNPTQVLGAIEDLDVHGGMNYRLKFKNIAAPVSLPMMMTFVSKLDAGFVRTLDCSARRLEQLMKNRVTYNKYFAMAPNRLVKALRAKGQEALGANRMLSKLSGAQMLVVSDTLLQLDQRAVVAPAEMSKVRTALMAKGEVGAAEIEFIQEVNRQLGDFANFRDSYRLMKAQELK